MKLLLFIHFVSSFIHKWNAFFVYYTYGKDESDAIQENLYYIIFYSRRNICIVKLFYCVCIIAKKDEYAINILHKYFYNPFLWAFI